MSVRNISRRGFIKTTALAAGAGALGAPAIKTQRHDRSRPNILLLFADQHRGDVLGCAGDPVVRTPALDRLANEGTRFARAYTPSPVCVPARFALLTGRYPHRNGCTDNGDPMNPKLPTIPGLLGEAGYQTLGVGKMHFHPVRGPFGFQKLLLSEEIPANPDQDEFLRDLIAAGFSHVHEPHGVRSELYYIPQVSQLPAHLHTTWWTADRTIDFLRQRNRNRPFFVWTSFIKPHPPFDPPVPWNKLYRDWEMPLPPERPKASGLITWHMRFQNHYKRRDAGTDENLLRALRAAYYASVSFVDYNIQRILDELERQGELDNTLIVYAADHGELLGDYGSFGKRCFYDPSARVPLIVRWPEKFEPGHVCQAPASLVDLLPTFLSAAGLEWEKLDVDGEPLQRVARGQANREAIFGQLGRKEYGVYFIFDGRFKYFYSAPDRLEVVLNPGEDPLEGKNLAGRSGVPTEELRKRLMGRLRRDGATEALDASGQAWALFDPPPEPGSPPSHFTQDARWTDPYLHIPVYERSAERPG